MIALYYFPFPACAHPVAVKEENVLVSKCLGIKCPDICNLHSNCLRKKGVCVCVCTRTHMCTHVCIHIHTQRERVRKQMWQSANNGGI